MAISEQTTEMSVTLRLTKQARAKLAERAAQSGQDEANYASELIEQAVTRPTVDEILAPVRADFAKSGMDNEALMDLGRRELNAQRAENKATHA